MNNFLEEIFAITMDDFVMDEYLWERWKERVDIEIGDGPANDGNFLIEPKRPIFF